MSEQLPSVAEEQALPGFSEFIGRVVTDRAGAVDMTDEKRYTAEVVLRDYPGVYDSVVRALFYYRLPNRTVRDLFRMSGATVAAIRNHVLAAGANGGAAVFYINSRRQSQRDIVLCQLLDLLEERLADKFKTDALSITDLTDLIARLETAKPASNGTERDRQTPETPSKRDITVVDADQFDEVLNGLVAQKKSAARIGVEGGAECSTGSDSDATSPLH